MNANRYEELRHGLHRFSRMGFQYVSIREIRVIGFLNLFSSKPGRARGSRRLKVANIIWKEVVPGERDSLKIDFDTLKHAVRKNKRRF